MQSNRPITQFLSEREQEIFLNLLDGQTNHDISIKLGIREKTVEEHLTHIYRKITVRNRSQAILWWIRTIKGFPSLTRKKNKRK